jgi:uncharacterized membrane protein YbhN (UPF0104 family)
VITPFRHLDRRALLAAVVALALLALLPLLVRDRLGRALEDVAAADGRWVGVAGACFLLVIAATAAAWRAGIRTLGGSVGRVDASARYAVGSLVNGIAPAGAGGAVRIGLFSRSLPERDRVLTATGIAAAIGVARTPALGTLVVAAAALGAFPLWPVLGLAALLAAAVGIAWWSRRWTSHARVAHVLDAFRALAQAPHAAVSLVGWVTLATAARVAGATAVAASLGVDGSLKAGLVMVPALSLAAAVPSVPGNVGVSSGAVAVALTLVGVDFGHALAVGLAFHALETVTSLAAGAGGLLVVARPRLRIAFARVTRLRLPSLGLPGVRLPSLRLPGVRLPAPVRYAGTGAGIALVGVLGLLVG